MLVAAIAFVQQGAMIGASQAAASNGIMPHPAVVLGGALHVHDNLAGHVHVHGGDNTAGHVHSAPNPHHHDGDDADEILVCSLAFVSVVLPIIGAGAASSEVANKVRGLSQDHREGVEPDGPSRPPSTPSIA
jgi:hypothetical protein